MVLQPAGASADCPRAAITAGSQLTHPSLYHVRYPHPFFPNVGSPGDDELCKFTPAATFVDGRPARDHGFKQDELSGFISRTKLVAGMGCETIRHPPSIPAAHCSPPGLSLKSVPLA